MSEKIKQQAKKIMDNFISALNKAEDIEAPFAIKREQNIRSPSAQLNTNEDFRDRVLKNAPSVKDGCIVVEKKKW